jgi:ribosome-associated toxin RatA of RatAB toxin-antitoxin module
MPEQTTSTIRIAAPPSQIMAVIGDVAAYPEWTPGVKSVEVLSTVDAPGSVADGRVREARFVINQAGISDEHVYVYEWVGDDEVSWTLREGGSMVKALDGNYSCRDAGDGTTEVSYSLSVDITIPMIGMMRRRAEKMITDTALKGLKRRVEG